MPPARKPAKTPLTKARAHRSPVPGRRACPSSSSATSTSIGLGLVAVGVFLAFPLYLGWEGGEAGQAIVDGLTWAVGRVAWATPVALVAAGALLVMRPALPAGVRPFRAGALCLLGAACLGLAVGTLGFGPGDGAPVAERGGHLGQVHGRRRHAPVLRRRRAHPRHLPVLRRAAAAHRRDRRRRAARHRRAGGRDGAHAAPAAAPAPTSPSTTPTPTQPLLPPDLEDEEVVIRPRTRTGELDGALRYPDLFEAAVAPPARPEAEDARARADPEPEPEPEPRPEPVAPRRRTRTPPLEHLDPGEVEFRLPDAAHPQALDAPSRSSPTPPARRRPPRGSSRRSATSACRRRSSAPWPARTSRATSCSSRPA